MVFLAFGPSTDTLTQAGAMAYQILASYFSRHSKPSCSKDILRHGSSCVWLSQLSRAVSKKADGTAALSTNVA